jgi:hypothetical protein
MIFTNCSWIGDFFLLWPVASGYYKETGDKIHWVCTKNYYMYPIVEEVLRHQEFTKDVTLVDVGTNAWDEHCWRFNPNDHGVPGMYMNFGFTGDLWGKYMPDFYASLHGLKVDNDYCIKLIDFPDKVPFKKVTMEVAHQKDGHWPHWRSLMPQDVVELDYKNQSFALNLWYSAKADERYFGCSSSPVLMDLMNLPCTIYGESSLGEGRMYYRNRFHNIIHT